MSMTATDRFKAGLAAIIAEMIPERRFLTSQRYRVVKSSGDGKVDAVHEDEKSGYPPLTHVPLRGLFAANAKSKLKEGSSILIAWIGGNRHDPHVIDVLDVPAESTSEAETKATITAPIIEVGKGADVVKIAGGTQPIIRVGDTCMGILAITGPGNPKGLG
jgi:hypothetical protein